MEYHLVTISYCRKQRADSYPAQFKTFATNNTPAELYLRVIDNYSVMFPNPALVFSVTITESEYEAFSNRLI